jgi:Rnl2 family RNA ligase
MTRVRHLQYPKIGVASGSAAAGQWIATEKLHGAQLVVATDGNTTRIGKRKAWLRADEPFFGWQLLRDRLTEAAHAALPGPGWHVRLYGELYGGAYPHPDVRPVPGISAVQTGVWYAPDLRFALFDVLVQDGADDRGEYLPYASVGAVAAVAGLDTVPLLRRGRRGELDAVPTRFTTTVPAGLGLPALPDNLAEGIVLRADRALPADRRPSVKRKIAEFDERRFDESRPFDADARLTPAELCTIAERMVNPARLASARSKVGTEPAAVADEVVLDVLVDLTDAFPAAMAALDGAAERTLRERVLAATAGG